MQRAPAKAPAKPTKPINEAVVPGEIDLKKQTKLPTASLDPHFADGQLGVVNVRYGKMASGQLKLRRSKQGAYVTANKRRGRPNRQALPIQAHPLAGQLGLSLIVTIGKDGNIHGYLGLASLSRVNLNRYKDLPDKLGLTGFSFESKVKPVNKLEGGSLEFGLEDVSIVLGGAFSGSITIVADDEKINKFSGLANIRVKGLEQADLEFEHAADKGVTAKGTFGLKLPKNITGTFEDHLGWPGRDR